MLKKLLAAVVYFGALSAGAFAGGNSLDFSLARQPEMSDRRMTEEELAEFSRELAVAVAPSAWGDVSPLGWGGLDFGAAMNVVDIRQYADYMKKPTRDHHPPEVYWLPRLFARLGLPKNFDLGASYSAVLGVGAYAFGGDLKYSIIPGSYLSSAVGVRAGYQKTFGIEGLDYSILLGELALSKEYPGLSLAGGVTEIYVIAKPIGIPEYSESGGAEAGGLLMHEPFTGLVARGFLAGAYNPFDAVWLYFEIGVGRVYSSTLAVKLMWEKE